MERVIEFDPREVAQTEPVEPALIPFHEHDHNTNEGSEYLDDAIRMVDQPYVEKSVGVGSPDILL